MKDSACSQPLEIGAFYWMQPAFDPDTEYEWENHPQPGRYEGDGKWRCLGIEGVSDWPARWVGRKLDPPNGARNAYVHPDFKRNQQVA